MELEVKKENEQLSSRGKRENQLEDLIKQSSKDNSYFLQQHQMYSLFEWRDEGHKYSCNNAEILGMVLITAVTNFSFIPPLILLHKKGLIYQTYIGIFTLVTSYIYHFMESIGAQRIFLTEEEWHQLDNIGSILCFIGVIIYMANFKDLALDMHLNFSALIIVIALQVADPWNILFTVLPIFGYIGICLIFLYKRKSKPFTNREMTIKGLFCIFLAAVFFALAQNKQGDYLRLKHGLWHLVIGQSAMYTWQSNEKPGAQIYLKELFSKNPRKETQVYAQYNYEPLRNV